MQRCIIDPTTLNNLGISLILGFQYVNKHKLYSKYKILSIN